MGSGWLGGGMMFIVIALLWGAVLVPAWFQRREFNAAERNALRLQRTLRVLAETAELPQELRIEATAREALAHERLLRTAQKRQEAERASDLAAAQAEQVRAEIRAQQMLRKQVAMNRAAKLRKPIVRRIRSLAALVGLVGVIGSLVGVGMMIAGIGPVVLLWSLLAFSLGLGSLLLLAPGRAKLEPIAAEQIEKTEPAARELFDSEAATGETDASLGAHELAQRAARERIERARAMARAREVRAAAPRVNQPDSMLLREVREQVARAHREGSVEGARTGGSAAVAAGSSVAGSSVAGTASAAASDNRSATKAGVVPKSTPADSVRRTAGAAESRRAALGSVDDLGVVGDTSKGMPDLDQVLRRRRSAS